MQRRLLTNTVLDLRCFSKLCLCLKRSLITKQKTVSTTKLNINIRESLDTIFTSSQVASGTANLIYTPELEVDFDCDNYYVGEFDSGINKGLGKTRIIFVPDRLKGKQLITWS